MLYSYMMWDVSIVRIGRKETLLGLRIYITIDCGL